MNLVLTSEEAQTLHDLLSDYLHGLRREVARTDAKEFRHALVLRQDLVERLVQELETGRTVVR